MAKEKGGDAGLVDSTEGFFEHPIFAQPCYPEPSAQPLFAPARLPSPNIPLALTLKKNGSMPLCE